MVEETTGQQNLPTFRSVGRFEDWRALPCPIAAAAPRRAAYDAGEGSFGGYRRIIRSATRSVSVAKIAKIAKIATLTT